MVQTAYLDTLLDPWSVCNVPGSRLLLKARRIHGLTKFGYSRTTTPVHEFTPPLLHGVSFNTAARAPPQTGIRLLHPRRMANVTPLRGL